MIADLLAAWARACQPRQRRIGLDGVLAQTVAQLLAKRWQPGAGRSPTVLVVRRARHGWLCAETSIRQSMTRWSRSRARSVDGVLAVGGQGASAGDGLAMRMLNQRLAEVLGRG